MARGETPAVRWLEAHGIEFTRHEYDYLDHGGAPLAATSLGLPPEAVVKTLVMEDDGGAPLLVLMHGDRQVAPKKLAAAIGGRRGLLVGLDPAVLAGPLGARPVSVSACDT